MMLLLHKPVHLNQDQFSVVIIFTAAKILFVLLVLQDLKDLQQIDSQHQVLKQKLIVLYLVKIMNIQQERIVQQLVELPH